MSLIASEKSSAGFDPIPAGTYTGVCYMMIDMGVQYNERFGNSSRKVRIGWEIPDLTVTIDGEEKPRVIGKTYTLSLNKKGSLRKDLVAWRGKDFTSEELASFDLRKIVGTSCLINVVQTDGAEGRTYSNVSGIMALPKGMPPIGMNSDPMIFDLDSDPLSTIAKFPQWIQDSIAKSETYQERLAKENAKPPKLVVEDYGPGADDDLPF